MSGSDLAPDRPGRPEWLCAAGPDLWRLAVWACPGAPKTCTDGTQNGLLRLKIAAPAVDNKANAEAERWLARTLGLKSRQVRLESGRNGRRKIFLLSSASEPDWAAL